MSKATKVYRIAVVIAIMAIVGYYREFLFININEQLRFLWYGNEPSHMSEKLHWLSTWSYWPLYYLKWFLTAAFSVLYLVVSGVAMRWALDMTAWRMLFVIYSLLIGIAALLFLGFWIFGDVEEGYLLSRYFMGLAQSPVPLMLCIPSALLRRRLTESLSSQR